MAAPIRHGSMTLLRRAAFHGGASSLARCFATTSTSLSDADRPVRRVNPLIGGIRPAPPPPKPPPPPPPPPPKESAPEQPPPTPPSTPSAPRPAPSAPRPAPSASSTTPSAPSTSPSAPSTTPSAPATPITPPPPPPAKPVPFSTPARADPSAAAAAPSGHAYSATKSGIPFQLDVASIISNKQGGYNARHNLSDPTQRQSVRTAAATGRTIFIRAPPAGLQPRQNSAPSLTVALNLLNRLTRLQHVKSKWYSQRFHERRGLKRKRLRAQRGAARFKESFCTAYVRVNELRKQGW